MKCVRQVWHNVSDNVAVGFNTQCVGHPEVVGVLAFVELDKETVGTICSLEEAWPGHPDTGEADLNIGESERQP